MVGRVEIITEFKGRQRDLLHALAEACPFPVRETNQPSGKANLLVMYGCGSPHKRKMIADHRGRYLCWDLAYWDRCDKLRFSIDGLHPTPAHMALCNTPGRWNGRLREDADPKGPILLAGMGNKSRYLDATWEARTLAKIKAAYPDREIRYKPKRAADAVLSMDAWYGDIEPALVGCSLVVCRTSNVAVNACVAGVPVVCEGGAAAALYGSDLSNPIHPTREQRTDFLNALGWWQWADNEARPAWEFIATALSA